MLSAVDLERLITVKRHEIQKEKIVLGLSAPHPDVSNNPEDDKENKTANSRKQVNFTETKILGDHNAISEDKERSDEHRANKETEENIPPDLERYIRRYTGIPVMLKAGEYSPNNPLIRGERASGDALLGLGEYERRRNTLRKLRQQQYREYLDQQAKLKQEAKEKAEIERREREQREREHEEREREREERERERERLERERREPERRRASMCYVSNSSSSGHNNKVDASVQVDGISRPLSVAVQTDDVELFRLSPSPTKGLLTEAERELSPHTVVDPYDEKTGKLQWGDVKWKGGDAGEKRRRSHADFDDRSTPSIKRTNRDKLASDLRHTYMPSIFDADAIQRRNLQAEKEAATKRQYYQQELKNQILEQQRIREERKAREKMLEQAEMRRLEEQLRMLRVAQEKEVNRHHDITNAMKDNATDYEKKRTALQKEIDFEQQALIRTTSQPSRVVPKRQTHTSQSDSIQNPSKLPFYYPRIQEKTNEITNLEKKQPFSINISENSIFSPNYDVESYLRRNLNPSKESLLTNRLDNSEQLNNNRNIQNGGNFIDRNYLDYDDTKDRNVIIERALVHEYPKERKTKEKAKTESVKMDLTHDSVDETLPIPVLRHSLNTQTRIEDNNGSNLSDAMKVIDDKWKVPAVQKNILKSLPNEDGKSVSILTQLGSIRRHLQLEQLKLDKMLAKDNDV